jgi:thioredoxin-related protein
VRRFLSGFLLCLAVLPAWAERVNLLETPWEDVLQAAAGQNRHVLVAFLGEDWSVACKRFKEDILEAPEFQAFAEKRLVYCPVKAHRMSSHAKQEAAKLHSLVIHFDIKEYPTILLFSPDGTELLRHGYRELPATEYVNLLEAILPAAPDSDQASE